jgi:hypothetical protein
MTTRKSGYPAGKLAETSVGGAVDGVGVKDGSARLVDAETGETVVLPGGSSVALVAHDDGRHYYRFDQVPDGDYRVVVELVDGRRLTSGFVVPGVEAGDVFAD